ncbi:MAG: helix-turn-helix transcriptional regulator [Ardenticatenaceae bacterium]
MVSMYTITFSKQAESAVIPYETYIQLVEDADMLQDIRDYDEAKQAIEEGEELVPSHITFAILDGENPIKVWREYRGLTEQALAEAAGLTLSELSQIENSHQLSAIPHIYAVGQALGLAWNDIESFFD